MDSTTTVLWGKLYIIRGIDLIFFILVLVQPPLPLVNEFFHLNLIPIVVWVSRSM